MAASTNFGTSVSVTFLGFYPSVSTNVTAEITDYDSDLVDWHAILNQTVDDVIASCYILRIMAC